jgi:Flp pilus assembly protein TadD
MAPKFLFNSLLLAVFFCLTICAHAQIGGIDPDPADKGTGGTTTLSGNVFLPSGQMLDRRIRVRLSAATRPELSTITDDNGAFSFHRLASGSYTLLIDEKGYEAVSEHIEISQRAAPGGTPGQTITVQVQLRYKARDETKPTVVSTDFANVPPEALDCYRKALQLAQAGDPKAAIDQLHKATSIYGRFVMAFNELGVQYLRLGDFENSRQSLESALKISPDAFIPHLNRGILFVVWNRCKEAEPDLRAAIALNDDSALAHYYLGRALARMRKFNEAETQLLRALTLKPDEVKEAHRYLGAIYNDRGDDAHALRELETYLQLVPNAKDAEQIRGIIHQLKQSVAGSGTR